MSATGPVLQAYPADRTARPGLATLQGFAPWSKPRSVAQALAAAAREVEVEVLSVQPEGDGHRVTIATDFVEQRVQVGFRCADPRWLTVGARFVALIVTDPTHPWAPDQMLEDGAVFFVPGVVLPSAQTAHELSGALHEVLPRR